MYKRPFRERWSPAANGLTAAEVDRRRRCLKCEILAPTASARGRVQLRCTGPIGIGRDCARTNGGLAMPSSEPLTCRSGQDGDPNPACCGRILAPSSRGRTSTRTRADRPLRRCSSSATTVHVKTRLILRSVVIGASDARSGWTAPEIIRTPDELIAGGPCRTGTGTAAPLVALSPWPTTPAALAIATAELAAALELDATDDEALVRRLGAAAAALVEQYAPAAPEPIRCEAALRCAGWLLDAPSAGIKRESAGPLDSSFSPTMTGALRHSGAMGITHLLEGAPGRGDRVKLWPWAKRER